MIAPKQRESSKRLEKEGDFEETSKYQIEISENLLQDPLHLASTGLHDPCFLLFLFDGCIQEQNQSCLKIFFRGLLLLEKV